MVCLMIKSKTYGTDLIGIVFWEAGSWLRCIELNTFLVDVHLYVDKIGEIKIAIGLFRVIYLKVALQIGDGA